MRRAHPHQNPFVPHASAIFPIKIDRTEKSAIHQRDSTRCDTSGLKARAFVRVGAFTKDQPRTGESTTQAGEREAEFTHSDTHSAWIRPMDVPRLHNSETHPATTDNQCGEFERCASIITCSSTTREQVRHKSQGYVTWSWKLARLGRLVCAVDKNM